MNKSFLITRPNYDPLTNCLFYWCNFVIEEAKHKNFKILDLKSKKSNRGDFESYIKKHEPILVFFNGHGSGNTIAGQDNEILIEAKQNEVLLSEKIVYARSCEAAKSLGHRVVQKGALAFIGYKEKYFLVLSRSKSTRPLEDKIARLFIEPSNLVVVSLIKGKTAGESYKKSQKSLQKKLLFLLTSEASQEQRDVAPFLLANKNNQALLGDQEARI